MSQLTRSAAWKALAEHRKKMGETSIRALFEADPKRFDKFVRKLPDALFDFSQHRIIEETLRLLVDLAKQADVAGFIERMFSADKINFTEGRAVLHIALRNRGDRAIEVDGEDVMPGVRRVLDKMRKLSDAVRSGEHKGYTGKPITDIVNIGIGGSDLGPVMATEALKPYWQDILRAYFVSNIDGTDLVETLEGLSPETTLFCVASKTFRPGRHLEHQQLRSMGRGARQAARHGHPARAGRNRLGRHARKLDQRSDQLHKQTRGKEMR